jgi:hypothetical protein
VLEADAQVRGLERSMQVRRAFPFEEQEKVTQLLNNDFPPLMQRLNQAVRSATPQPDDVHAILVEMDPINEWFLEHSLKELNRVVESRGG